MPRITIIGKDDQPYKLYAKRPAKPAPGILPEGDLIKRDDQPGESLWTRDIALRRYPRIVAHMIAESLGYFTPSSAAKALADALNGHENWCEFIHSCYAGDPVKMVRRAIALRKNHTGYTAEYEKGIALAVYEIEGMSDPMALAGWF